MRRNALFLLALGVLLAACTIVGPETSFRPTGSGATLSSQSGSALVYDPNEAPPSNADSLEPGVSSSAAPIEIHTTSGSLIMGNLNASVTLTIYDDYSCLYCREFGMNDLPWVMQTYVAEKKLNVERVFAPQSPAGTLMAKVALCSVKQNLFEATDTALHSFPITTDTQVTALAKVLNLNLKSLQTCMASVSTQTTLQASIDRTKAAGVTRFPSFELQNDHWIGVETRDELRNRIEKAL